MNGRILVPTLITIAAIYMAIAGGPLWAAAVANALSLLLWADINPRRVIRQQRRRMQMSEVAIMIEEGPEGAR